MEYINILIIIAGLISSRMLFYKFPNIGDETSSVENIKVSIIIPARNEESNLPNLLQDLKEQDYSGFEIICVDDCSCDKTFEIASDFKAKVIKVEEKPEGWVGKSWACQLGANNSTGDVLVFMDADVRLSKRGIRKIISSYIKNGCTISVQPFHMMQKRYENLSLVFNIMQIAAYGLGLPFNHKNVGLYGPLIIINADTYKTIGGHSSIRKSIVDDVALGRLLTKNGIPFKTFIGDEDISFRMYGDGFRCLIQGWTKNVATGAVSTYAYLVILVSLWMTSAAAIFFYMLIALIDENPMLSILYLFLYIIWVIEIKRVSYRLGNFRVTNIIFFPIYVWFFIFLFAISMVKKVLHIKVTWKGRKIEAEK